MIFFRSREGGGGNMLPVLIVAVSQGKSIVVFREERELK